MSKPPDITCKTAYAVMLNEQGEAFVTHEELLTAYTDNCDINATDLAITEEFSCFHITGPQQITITLTDVHGNQSSCLATVYVSDPDQDEDGIGICLDCNDTDKDIYPGAPEVCYGKDNDCDDLTDDDDPDVEEQMTWYEDKDGDGHGNQSDPGETSCNPRGNRVGNNDDFDDNDKDRYPGVPEICDGKDNDGNNLVDLDDPNAVDDEAPVAICKNIEVRLNANGQVEVLPEQIDSNSTDNCGIASMAVDQTIFNQDNLGDNPVQLTVSDLFGNESTCTAIVTVKYTSGLFEAMDQLSFIVYPNPVKSHLSINTQGQKLISLEIYDPSGRLIQFFKNQGIPATIPVIDLAPGLYFIQAKTFGEAGIYGRFIKTKE